MISGGDGEIAVLVEKRGRRAAGTGARVLVGLNRGNPLAS